jgi:hypothetical protein
MLIPTSLTLLLSIPAAQSQPANAACVVLTADEAASIVGAGGHTMGVSATPTGASCMIQNGDKVITILRSTLGTEDAAKGLWSSKKRIVSGADVPGWPAQAYAGTLVDASAVGIVKGTTFIEVRVTEPKGKAGALLPKLQEVMKAVAGRMH